MFNDIHYYKRCELGLIHSGTDLFESFAFCASTKFSTWPCQEFQVISLNLHFWFLSFILFIDKRPQNFGIDGKPKQSTPPLVDFANCITKGIGLTVCGHVVEVNIFQKFFILKLIIYWFKGSLSLRARSALITEANHWLQKRKIKAFYNIVEEESLAKGVKSMIQVLIWSLFQKILNNLL